MGIYAAVADVDEVLLRWEPGLTPATTEGEITNAENDIDRAIRTSRTRDVETGRKLNVDDLEDWQKGRLVEAVAAQIMYRSLHGADFFIRDQYADVSSSGSSPGHKGKLPYVSPYVISTLSDIGLIDRLGAVGGRGSRLSWEDIGWERY